VAFAALTTPLPLPRVPSALPGTLGNLPNFSARKGMRSGRAPLILPRGAVADVATAPAPLGVCATGRGVASALLLLVATIVLFRVQGCEEGRTGVCVYKSALVCVYITAGPSTKLFTWGGGDMGDTPKVFCRPGTNFRYRREPHSNFHVCPLFGTP
jgi:hypothetical protein